jgi:hypothetical protein
MVGSQVCSNLDRGWSRGYLRDLKATGEDWLFFLCFLLCLEAPQKSSYVGSTISTTSTG